MGIATFFDKTVIVRRFKESGGKSTLQATATVDGAIQTMDRTERFSQGFNSERAWIGWFDIETDIKEGDQIERQDTSQIFKVVEVTKKDYGINEHLEVIFVEYNE